MSKELKIKTAVVKRTFKELHMYQKEETTQKARIEKLKVNNADEHDVRKQLEVLEETLVMIPDCHKRLASARQDLEVMLSKFDSKDSLEAKEALEALAETEINQ